MAVIKKYLTNNIYIRIKGKQNKLMKDFQELFGDDSWEFFLDKQDAGVVILAIDKSTGKVKAVWGIDGKRGNYGLIEFLKNCNLKEWNIYKKYYDTI